MIHDSCSWCSTQVPQSNTESKSWSHWAACSVGNQLASHWLRQSAGLQRQTEREAKRISELHLYNRSLPFIYSLQRLAAPFMRHSCLKMLYLPMTAVILHGVRRWQNVVEGLFSVKAFNTLHLRWEQTSENMQYLFTYKQFDPQWAQFSIFQKICLDSLWRTAGRCCATDFASIKPKQ